MGRVLGRVDRTTIRTHKNAYDHEFYSVPVVALLAIVAGVYAGSAKNVHLDIATLSGLRER